MINYLCLEEFAFFVDNHQHEITIHRMEAGNAIFYLGFIAGKAVAQFVDYKKIGAHYV